MANNAVPTKGNLLATKKSLQLSRTGFELLDRKRNILIREMMQLIDRANEIQSKIDDTYTAAYAALGNCQDLACTVPLDNGLNVAYRSVMGVEIPMVELEKTEPTEVVPFGLANTNTQLDIAYCKFQQVKELTAELAEVENSVYRLADAIKKTQKRANALKNIMIPRFTATVKIITEALEEKDREEFSRMKVIKNQKLKAARLEEELKAEKAAAAAE